MFYYFIIYLSSYREASEASEASVRAPPYPLGGGAGVRGKHELSSFLKIVRGRNLYYLNPSLWITPSLHP